MAKLKRHATLNEGTNPYAERGKNPASEPMTINDFSEEMINFYDSIKKFAPSMQDETVAHLKEAFKHLDQAWQGEADAHGVDFTPYGEVFK
jgi:hypothetical protein